MKISSWGRLSADSPSIITLDNRHSVKSKMPLPESAIAFGMGRSYGDVCTNADGSLILTQQLNHFISFNTETGILTCEAGVLLRDIQRLAVPNGWMLAVTPGTQIVTLGGAIANDVHGKNHHVLGTFCDHVRNIKLVRSNGDLIECNRNQHADWFRATAGGLGLTGIIVEATIQLRRVNGAALNTQTIPFNNVQEFFSLATESEQSWEYTVAWVDCMSSESRGIFMRANHAIDSTAKASGANRNMPFTPPFSLVNAFTLKPFNSFYFHLHKWNAGNAVSHYEPFFYPLDNLSNWNRIYGPRGFYQYQCVIPEAVAEEAIKAMLALIKRSGTGSFLAVLKKFGEKSPAGMLSFPMPGTTLALDFPNKEAKTHELFNQLDNILMEAGGRIYCAKDARMPRTLFEKSYPRIEEFLQYRDPHLSSSMSRRLFGY